MEKMQAILPGMYVYDDNQILPEIIAGRQIKAVVGYVEDSTIVAVCRYQRAKRMWSLNTFTVAATQKMTSGQEATRLILKENQKRGFGYADAAEYCDEYSECGVKQGEAFLPSLTELEKLFTHRETINASLSALGAPLLDGRCWSSNECSYDSAWRFNMTNGRKSNPEKENINTHTRPIIKIQL